MFDMLFAESATGQTTRPKPPNQKTPDGKKNDMIITFPETPHPSSLF
jgi:hypothetical protein